MPQTKLHRPHVGLIKLSFLQRLVVLFRGELWFATRKEIEVAWSIGRPKELKLTPKA